MHQFCKKCTKYYFVGTGKRRKEIIFECEVCPYSTRYVQYFSGHIIHKHQTDSVYNVMEFINETYNIYLDEISAAEQQYIAELNGAEKATNLEIGNCEILFIILLIVKSIHLEPVSRILFLKPRVAKFVFDACLAGAKKWGRGGGRYFINMLKC